jgi:Lrp/AsnC family transcriptional regulator, leucine-responsive regulatory protein
MLDAIDRKILQCLHEDGRASVETVAARIGLSPTPVRRRIRQLEEAQIIRGYRADVDLSASGLPLTLIVFIKLQSRDRATIAQFESRIRSLREVLNCRLITGSADYMLTLQVSDMAAYNDYLRIVLAELPGVFGIETSVVISEIKTAGQLPL